jgi:hypothetical protein
MSPLSQCLLTRSVGQPSACVVLCIESILQQTEHCQGARLQPVVTAGSVIAGTTLSTVGMCTPQSVGMVSTHARLLLPSAGCKQQEEAA